MSWIRVDDFEYPAGWAAATPVEGPLNILAGPGCLAFWELERLGVAPVSFGSKPVCATLGLVQRVASGF